MYAFYAKGKKNGGKEQQATSKCAQALDCSCLPCCFGYQDTKL